MAKRVKRVKEEEESKPFNFFKCSCDESKEMEVEEFKKHLLEVHELTPDKIKGNKQMIMHMDMAKSYTSTYKWTLEGGLVFHQFCGNPRAMDDPMRYDY